MMKYTVISRTIQVSVSRPTDYIRTGTGRLKISETYPHTILGIGTEFFSELSPSVQIMLPKSVGLPVAEVAEVISNIELRIKTEFRGDSDEVSSHLTGKLEKLRTQGEAGLTFSRLSHVDQRKMYYCVHQCLNDGGPICIFPEGGSPISVPRRTAVSRCTGGSHDRADFLPFKAAAALMALGAMAEDPNYKVKIVPVGLSYFHPHRFRPRAVVEFGAALDVPEKLIEKYKDGGDDEESRR